MSSEKVKPSLISVVGANIGIGVVKTLTYTYDLATLPLYTVFQRPWITWRNRWVAKFMPTEYYSAEACCCLMSKNVPP